MSRYKTYANRRREVIQAAREGDLEPFKTLSTFLRFRGMPEAGVLPFDYQELVAFFERDGVSAWEVEEWLYELDRQEANDNERA